MFAKPDSNQLASVYKRLVAGDAAAPEEMAQLTIEPLTDVLRIGKRGARDASIAYDAAVDAIMDLLRAPQKYATSLSSLWSFLEMAARRNVADRRLGERRRDGRIARLRKNVALSSSASNKNKEGMLDQLARREASKAFWSRVKGASDSLPSAEAKILELMASGVRATPEYARVLGMVAAPLDEQALAVKRAKDRVRKRLKRRLCGITV